MRGIPLFLTRPYGKDLRALGPRRWLQVSCFGHFTCRKDMYIYMYMYIFYTYIFIHIHYNIHRTCVPQRAMV